MTYYFYHTLESGRQVGYRVDMNRKGEDMVIDNECVLRPLLYSEDEHEFNVFTEYMNQEIFDLVQENFAKE